MAKLTLLLTSFALLLLVANASIYRATIEIDEENSSGRQQSCQEQIQSQQQLRHCQRHLMQEVQGQQSGGSRDIINPQQQQQHLRQCCQQLQDLDKRCRCQGLEQAVKQQQQQGQLRGEEAREAIEIASEIPSRCKIQPKEGCDFRSSYYLSF